MTMLLLNDFKKLLFLSSIITPYTLFAQETINLDKPGSRPIMYVYRPADIKETSHTAVIICSGGSYGRTADEEEGVPAAKMLAANGITAFLLDYRIPQGMDSLPLSDAQKAIRYVREHAKDYQIESSQIGIMGFSAGGHLASSIGTHWKSNYDNTSDTTNVRPDFMVLVYPVISFAEGLTHSRSRSSFLGSDITPARIIEFSNELQVKDDTPPAFIVHAIDDGDVRIENSLYFEAALRQHHVPVEMFLYAKGGHGFGVYNETASAQWTEACIEWIRKL